MRKYVLVSALILVLLIFASPLSAQARHIQQAPGRSSALDLLDAVNAVRAAHGLPAYHANAILMGITQTQAEYLASSGLITHTGADGSKPYQRALAAGYPLAGDISLGGYYSEDVAAATNMTAQDAVTQWMGDLPHQITMLSSMYQDAGAGMAVSSGVVYFALDAGLSTGGTPAAYTPPSQSNQASSTAVGPAPAQSTSATITYVVRSGDTLDSIAQNWGVSVDAILQRNNLTLNSIIYAGQNLEIPVTVTPLPTPLSSSTLTPSPASIGTQTGIPTAQLTDTPPPASDPSSKALSPMVGVLIIGIGVLLLAVAGLLVFNRARSGKQNTPTD